MNPGNTTQYKALAPLGPPVDTSRQTYRDWLRAAVNCHLPVDNLPVFLLPRRSQKPRLQPPRLHFGWPFHEKTIIEIGRKKQFVTAGVCYFPEPLEFVDLEPTETRVQEIICDELLVPASSCKPRILRVYSPNSDYFLTLTNNYLRGDYTPPPADIEKIREYFGFEEPPRWYMDAEGYGRWGCHPLNKTYHS